MGEELAAAVLVAVLSAPLILPEVTPKAAISGILYLGSGSAAVAIGLGIFVVLGMADQLRLAVLPFGVLLAGCLYISRGRVLRRAWKAVRSKRL